jgi:hypothetical protein
MLKKFPFKTTLTADVKAPGEVKVPVPMFVKDAPLFVVTRRLTLAGFGLVSPFNCT